MTLPDWIVHEIKTADGLLITAGAGMGVDSGLPDFRGNEGFWNAYPALKLANMSFIEAANPQNFVTQPDLAWGFYGHRLNLYRQTIPHAGFAQLKALGETKANGYFVFTSNVDGQFQAAGFNPECIAECHGSIHHLQCATSCSPKIWSADQTQVTVNNEKCLAETPLPTCPDCGNLARPNILMFGDYHWLSERTDAQQNRLAQWLQKVEKLLVIECGAGTSVPTVRYFSEGVGGTLIRINPREAQLDGAHGISLNVGAENGINRIYQSLTL